MFCVSTPNETLRNSNLKIDTFSWPKLYPHTLYVYVCVNIYIYIYIYIYMLYSSLNYFSNYVSKKNRIFMQEMIYKF